MSNKLNILYHRVSSKTQEDNTSLEYQKDKLTTWCKDKDIPNTLYVCDVDSGANNGRTGIKTITELISQNMIDTIYITKLRMNLSLLNQQ